MIAVVRDREFIAGEVLADVLGHPVSNEEVLDGKTVAAYWPRLDYFTGGAHMSWTSAQWAEYLEDPLLESPTASPDNDRNAIFRLSVYLHSEDRSLSGLEWSEVAHRFARASGITIPGEDDNGCCWVAVRTQENQLDLLANLIRADDTWTKQPPRLEKVLNVECRRIEADPSASSRELEYLKTIRTRPLPRYR